MELINSINLIDQTPIQVLLGLYGVKYIVFLTIVILVPALKVIFLIEDHTVIMGALMASGIICFTLYGVELVLIARNPRALLGVDISLLVMCILILLASVILVFTIHASPIILGF